MGEVIQKGAEKRKSRDQDREDAIKSLIIIYIYIYMYRKVYVKLNIYKRKACLKIYVFRHDLKCSTKLPQSCLNGGYHGSLFWW